MTTTPFDKTAFPNVDAAIASSPYTLKSGWLHGTDEDVLKRIAPVRWDPDRDGDIVGKHLQAAIEANRPAVVRAMLAQGMPLNLAWSPALTPTLKARHPVSALRTALERGSAAMVKVLLDHRPWRGSPPLSADYARLTVEEYRDKPLVLRLLGQAARRQETPEQRRAREAEILAALAGHPQMPRSSLSLVDQAVADGVDADVLDRLLDHGLARATGQEGATLLATALRSGHPRLVHRLLERGARPDPQDEHPVALAAQAPRPPREVLNRWQHRAMRSIETLADAGLLNDLPDRPLPPPEVAPRSTLRRPPEQGSTPAAPDLVDLGLGNDARWRGAPTDRLLPLLRLIEAGVWPSRWWAALDALDETFVTQALAGSGGGCAAWCTLRNRNALHALVRGLGARTKKALPPSPSAPAVPRRSTRRLHDPVVLPTDAEPTEADRQAVAIAERLLAHGASPLRAANRDEPGALWAALDLPCPDLARTLFAAVPTADREGLVHEAVIKRRSWRTIGRLVSLGAPVNGLDPRQGIAALHSAAARAAFQDQVPLLLALGASPDVLSAQGHTPVDLVRDVQAGLSATSPLVLAFQEVAVLLETASLHRALGQTATLQARFSSSPFMPKDVENNPCDAKNPKVAWLDPTSILEKVTSERKRSRL